MWSEVCALCYSVLFWGWLLGGSQGCQLWASSFLLPRESLMACHANRRTSHSLLYDMGGGAENLFHVLSPSGPGVQNNSSGPK